MTFTVHQLAGLFPSTNGFPFTGTIQIVSYLGNNAENNSDYEAAATATIGSFSTAGLVAGNVLSFDVTSALNAAIAAGNPSFGIRLAAVPLNPTGALTFRDFSLTADSQCTVVGGCGVPVAPTIPQDIPTLGEWGLMLLSLILAATAFLALRRRAA